MASNKGSHRDLQSILAGGPAAGGPAALGATGLASSERTSSERKSMSTQHTQGRIIIASNHLPLRVKARGSPPAAEGGGAAAGATGPAAAPGGAAGDGSSTSSAWEFEWDEDALVAQARDGIPRSSFSEVLFVGSLPVDIELEEQEVRRGGARAKGQEGHAHAPNAC